ncbi:MAG TPA: GTP-binding protein [Alphaproteobacteria bacterium]|nr:GTP-binding protein [Alphaproteobacteria bacterium]
MAAEIIILSGFLGAGKTTLLQGWLKAGAFHGKTAVVENDFGEVGVDAQLLRSGNISVTELSAGCICCSLSGNFVRALEELIENYAPDTILIEPSGVGMLSDVKKACANPRILPLARVRCAVTIVICPRIMVQEQC